MLAEKCRVASLIFLLSSCAGNLVVSSTGLKGNIPLSLDREMRTLKYPRHTQVENFQIKKEVWLPIFGVSRRIRLVDVLKESEIKVENIRHLNYFIETDTGDAIRNMFPFIGAKTLVIRGYSDDFETLDLKQDK